MNSKFCALLFTFVLLFVSTNAGRLQYVFHTAENFDPSIAGSQAVHLVKRSAFSSGALCPDFSGVRCTHSDVPVLCKPPRVFTTCPHVVHRKANL